MGTDVDAEDHRPVRYRLLADALPQRADARDRARLTGGHLDVVVVCLVDPDGDPGARGRAGVEQHPDAAVGVLDPAAHERVPRPVQ